MRLDVSCSNEIAYLPCVSPPGELVAMESTDFDGGYKVGHPAQNSIFLRDFQVGWKSGMEN